MKGLQECSTALTVNAQLISSQLQQISKEIQEAKDPTRLDQLYAQADVLEVQIQQIEETSMAAKQAIQELRQPVKLSTQTM